MTLFPAFAQRLATGAVVSIAALTASGALAQDNRIELRSLDGAMSLEGTFIGFRDGVYVLDHASLGTLRIEATDQITCTGAACPGNEPEPEPVPEPVVAVVDRTIQLTTGDGRFSVDGEFVEVSADSFIIDTPTLGRLSIEIVPGLQCIGAACPELAGPNAGRLIIGPAREMSELMPTLLEAYAAERDANLIVGEIDADGQVPVRLATSGGDTFAEFLIATKNVREGVAELTGRNASLIITDRRLSDQDLSATGLDDLRSTDREQKLALDALVLVTNPANPVQALTRAEISSIWSGELTNWLGLGGGNEEIAAGAVLDAASDVALFQEVILAPNGGTTAAVSTFQTAEDLIGLIQADPGAIGLMRRSEAVTAGLNLIDIEESCGLMSASDDFGIKSGSYILSKELYSYSAPQFATPELADFTAWLGSDAARSLIANANYLDATPQRMGLHDMGLALIHTAAVEADFSGEQFVQVVRELRDAERSSVAFRFEAGSATLDRDSALAVETLAAQIASGAFEGFEILLVGFSDSSGPADVNTALAQERAAQVSAALEAALPENVNTSIASISAGELMPTSCNTDPAGRERNRRVETWIRLQG